VALLDVTEAVWILGSELIQHRFRDVDPGDMVTEAGEPEGETTGTNAQLQQPPLTSRALRKSTAVSVSNELSYQES